MDFSKAKPRYQFLAEALQGAGGFLPTVTYQDVSGLQKPTAVLGKCHLVPYPRESQEKFAARAACATYENHLLSACERFAAYLARKSPSRQGADSPLVSAFIADADDAGRPLNVVLHELAIQTKARGAMLVLIDMPAQRSDARLDETVFGPLRAMPYLTLIAPETVTDYAQDDRGRFTSVGIASACELGGKSIDVIRRWSQTGWEVWQGKTLLSHGDHPFGACPMLALTESGGAFPQVGKFSQIADLSKRLFNARSELDEILRSQTFSLLTLQIPPEVHNPAESVQTATATIGTHSLLVHQGATPAFIAPDSGPAQVYGARIAELQAAIARIGMESASEPGQQAESGAARRMRFEALNADLAGFARLMQALEVQLWALFHTALGLTNRIEVQWPTDYNLTDSAAELDILALMQATGFPEAVLREKRRLITLAEFDRSGQSTLSELMAAIDEQAQAQALP